ncbi:MAG: hypothetical protein QM775_35650 [Pirellulales bacterium]
MGVGQSEIEIARHADRTCVVVAPGLGDGIQWLKAGLMEIADDFIVNKNDRDGAAAVVAQLNSAIERLAHQPPRRRLRPMRSGHQVLAVPSVQSVSAELGHGIDELLDTLQLSAAAPSETAAHA